MGHLLSTRPPPICGGRALGPTKLCTRDTAGRNRQVRLRGAPPRSVLRAHPQPAPKSAWRTLSEVYTLRGLKYTATTGLPFARPICPERAFQQRWQDLLAPLELAPAVSTSDPKATGISWPWASWLRYIASQPPLCRMIDWSFPLTFIVRGDGYPCAGGEWSQLSVSIANMGVWGRIPPCVWVIGLAICGDKAMATLATLWEDNIKVPRTHPVVPATFR